jgi:hypothetical protein
MSLSVRHAKRRWPESARARQQPARLDTLLGMPLPGSDSRCRAGDADAAADNRRRWILAAHAHGEEWATVFDAGPDDSFTDTLSQPPTGGSGAHQQRAQTTPSSAPTRPPTQPDLRDSLRRQQKRSARASARRAGCD